MVSALESRPLPSWKGWISRNTTTHRAMIRSRCAVSRSWFIQANSSVIRRGMSKGDAVAEPTGDRGANVPKARQAPLNSSILATRLRISGVIWIVSGFQPEPVLHPFTPISEKHPLRRPFMAPVPILSSLRRLWLSQCEAHTNQNRIMDRSRADHIPFTIIDTSIR